MSNVINRALNTNSMDEMAQVLGIGVGNVGEWIDKQAADGLDDALLDKVIRKYAFHKMYPYTTDPIEIGLSDDEFIFQTIEQIKIKAPIEIEKLKMFKGDRSIYDPKRIKYNWFSFMGSKILIVPRIATRPIIIDKVQWVLVDGKYKTNKTFGTGKPIICDDVQQGVMAINAFYDHAWERRFDADILLLRKTRLEVEKMFETPMPTPPERRPA